jgi:Leucine-rich repeat (LRR) protein
MNATVETNVSHKGRLLEETFSLEYLDLSKNNMMELSETTFSPLLNLQVLDLSDNLISNIHSGLFNENKNLKLLILARNNVSHIHPSAFQYQKNLYYLDVSGNNITVIHQDTFKLNENLRLLILRNNRIPNVHTATFRYQTNIHYLDMSGNNIKSLEPQIFQSNINLKWLLLGNNNIVCINASVFLKLINLTYIDISGNRITDLDTSAFRTQNELGKSNLSDCKLQRAGSNISSSSLYGLEQLEHIDLSNNSIEGLSPLVFQHIVTYRHGGGDSTRMCRLEYLNQDGKQIRYFKLKEYLPFNSTNNSAVTTFSLVFLNKNRMESLDSASVKWLTQSTAGVDFAGNPRRCECATLWEAWRVLHNKLTLFCVSPGRLIGDTSDKIYISYPDMNTDGEFHDDVNHKAKASATAHSLTTESAGHKQKDNNGIYISLAMTLLIVNGVILVCALLGGAFILVRYVKTLKTPSKASEYSHVHVPPPQMGLSIRSSSDSNSHSGCATGHVYETII